MAKRNAGNKARAEDQTAGGVNDRRGQRVSYVAVSAEGKDITQVLAEAKAQTMFTDMMAGAGVHPDRMALEVLYWLPRDFMDMYMELYNRGLRNTDGGTGERGQAAAETGALGKAPRKTAGGATKKYKKYWTVADEQALDIKQLVDKRLRGMAREITNKLAEIDWHREHGEGVKPRSEVGTGKTSPRQACGECGIIQSLSWHYCPRCGCPTGKVAEKGNDSTANRQAG